MNSFYVLISVRKRKILLLLLTGLFIGLSVPNLFYQNKGESKSIGSHGNGSLENAYQVPYKLKNASYFSPVSYYLLNNGFTHSKLHQTLIDSYKESETTCPKTKFKLMECSNKKGGKMLIHKTHRNGLSIDFMVPLKKKERQKRIYDKMGLWHYLLQFDENGKLNIAPKTEIDFETMAKHIIALDNAGKKNGLRIKKVILKINLKDDFYRTKSGKEVKQRGIYFAQSLPKIVDNLHDDHYHIDFELVH